MSDALKAGLSARLGVTDAEISDDDLLAAVDEVLDEQTDTPAAPAATVPGTQLIEDNVLARCAPTLPLAVRPVNSRSRTAATASSRTR